MITLTDKLGDESVLIIKQDLVLVSKQLIVSVHFGFSHYLVRTDKG